MSINPGFLARGIAAHPEELNRIWILRKVLSELTPMDAMELMQERLQATKQS